jgi:hypothetical protein
MYLVDEEGLETRDVNARFVNGRRIHLYEEP